MIHILDKKTDEITAFLSKEVLGAIHEESLDYRDLFDFTIKVGEKSQFVKERSRAIIQADDGSFSEFIIINTETLADSVLVKCNPSYLDLDKQKVIVPGFLEGQTLESAAAFCLSGTEWQVGKVEFSGSRKINFDNYLGVFEALKLISTEFEVEMRFRVEIQGNKIIGRFVDFFKRRGQFRGKEVVFAKDLLEIRRIEDSQNIVTALFCIGSELEDGSHQTTAVIDEDALQRWGRNGRHLWSVYEPESRTDEMTLSQLEELGKKELKNRINSLVRYETTQAVLDTVVGYEHEKVFIADTIRIKDLHYTPPLYAEARVNKIKRSLLDKSQKEYTLGDFIEYSEAEIRKRFKELQKSYGVKVIKSPLPPTGKYGVIWIDTSGQIELIKTWNGVSWVKATPTRAEEIGAETPAGAQGRADKARDEAKDYADKQDTQVQIVIKDEITKEGQKVLEEAQKKVEEIRFVVDEDITQLTAQAENILQRVSSSEDELAEADGKITTINENIDTINGSITQSITQLSNLDGVVAEQQSSLQILSGEIEAKASKTSVDSLSGRISEAEGSISSIAGQIVLKANATEVYSKNQVDTELAKKVDTTLYSNNMSELDVSINGISGKVQATELSLDNLTGEVNTAMHSMSALEQTANSITSKVSTLETNIENISGGQNLIQNSQFKGGLQAWTVGDGSWTVDGQMKLLGENTVRFNHHTGNYPMLRSIMLPVEGTEIIGSKVTLSVYIWIPNNFELSSGNRPYIQICGYEDPNSTTNNAFQTFNVPNNIDREKWVRISVTATINPTFNSVQRTKYIAGLIRFNGTEILKTAEFWYGLPQMELGNQALSWSPSSKDFSERADWAEAQIELQADQIQSKVSTTDYTGAKVVSMINQTATNIKIAAENIDLIGKISANMLNVQDLSAISANLGNVTAGTINGVTINTTKDINVGDNLVLGSLNSVATKQIKFNNHAAIKGDGYSFNIDSGGKMIINSYSEMNISTNESIKFTSPVSFFSGSLVIRGLNLSNSHIENANNIYTIGDRVRIQKTTGTAYFMGDTTVALSSMKTNGASLMVGADGTGSQVWSPAIYNRTYGSAANVHITSYGTLGRSTSATKYKLNIKEVDAEYPYRILSLVPKTWYDKASAEAYASALKAEEDGEEIDWNKLDIPFITRLGGLIAEDVLDAGLSEYIEFGPKDKDGNREVEGLMYDRLLTLLVPIVRDQKERIDHLEKMVL